MRLIERVRRATSPAYLELAKHKELIAELDEEISKLVTDVLDYDLFSSSSHSAASDFHRWASLWRSQKRSMMDGLEVFKNHSSYLQNCSSRTSAAGIYSALVRLKSNEPMLYQAMLKAVELFDQACEESFTLSYCGNSFPEARANADELKRTLCSALQQVEASKERAIYPKLHAKLRHASKQLSAELESYLPLAEMKDLKAKTLVVLDELEQRLDELETDMVLLQSGL